MTDSIDIVSKVLFQSLIKGPLLLEDLPEAKAFPCHSLVPPKESTALNLQQKLGHLYEDALAVMLKSTPRYNCLAQGVQVRENAGHTLGELDFLVRDLVSDQLIHLELAVKFYLAIETESGVLLPGPDARDNYFRKLEKMRSHQLALAKNFRALLPDKFQEEEIVVQQLVHGCVFNHVHASQPVEEEFLNPNGRRGKWLHAQDCADYFAKDSLLEIIPKPLWPVPLEMMEEIELERWKPNEQIDRCVLVRAIVGKNSGEGAKNLPYFIAPNEYPFETPLNRKD